MKVLIVDAFPTVRERLAEMLRELDGIELVGWADDAFDALDKFEKLKENRTAPDAVIVDIKLVAGNGIGVLRYIKAYHPRTTVIIFTDCVTPPYRAMCTSADHFLDKTTEFMRVPEVLIKAMERQCDVMEQMSI